MSDANSAPMPAILSTARRHIEHDVLLGALPHPILVLGEDDRIVYANTAAEEFFEAEEEARQDVKVSFAAPAPPAPPAAST